MTEKVKSFYREKHIYRLDSTAIDTVSDCVYEMLEKLNYDINNALRIRLSVEEVLLIWRDKFGDGTKVVLDMVQRLRKPYIRVILEGEKYNPLEETEEVLGDWGQNLLAKYGLCPSYTYLGGKNTVTFALKPPSINPVTAITAAAFLGAGCGVLGFVMPESMRIALAEGLLVRINDTFFGFLSMIAGPLVFLSVLTGICGIGDTAALSGIGKRIVLKFLSITTAAAVLCGIVYVLVFGFFPSGTENGFQGLAEIAELFFGMFPSNMFKPFIDGNSLQIIVLSVLFGVSMLILGERTSGIYSIIEQLQLIVQIFMEWIGKLIPAVIFVIVLQNFWSGSVSKLLEVWKPLVFTIAFTMALMLVYVAYTANKLGMKTKLLAHKLIKSFMLVLSTGSSSAAFGSICGTCENKLGISRNLVDFGVPLGTIVGAAGSAAEFVVCVLYSAQYYGVEISLVGLAVTVITCIFLVVSAPPVAGGLLSCYTVIFSQLAIPLEGLAVVATLTVILDFVCTAVDVTINQMTLANEANQMNLLEKDILYME